MNLDSPATTGAAAGDTTLEVYLLGSIDFDSALALQRRLVYEIAGDRTRAALILCEHPPLITVGRQGSRAHILCDPDDLRARQWSVRWVNRGGGCWLHAPGQLAIYPILALDKLGLSIPNYLESLHGALHAVAADSFIATSTRPGQAGLWGGDRLLAAVGIAVHDWVTYYGAVLNINPALMAFRLVRCTPHDGLMTSLERERRAPVRPALVRERLAEHFAARFPFGRTTFFTDHPSLARKARSDALASRS